MSTGLKDVLRELPERVGSLLSHVHISRHSGEVLQLILKTAMELVGADRGDFVMLDPRGDLRIVAICLSPAHGPPSPKDKLLPIGAECPKQSFMWSVWSQDEHSTRIVGDVAPLPADEYHRSDGRTLSEAATRIYFGGRKLGVLNVEAFRRDAFNGREQQLELLAKYAGIAWQLFDEHNRQTDLLASVLTQGQPANGRGLKPVLREILDVVHELFDFNGLIYMVKGDRLEVCGWHWKGREIPFGYKLKDRSFAGHVFRQGPTFEPDVRRPTVSVSRKGIKTFNIEGSLVGVPLDCAGDRVGVLVCWGDRPESRPEEWHKYHLMPVSILAAYKIHLWRVERERERHRKELERQKIAFESLMDNVPVCVLRKDEKGFFTYANKACIAYFGKKSEADVLGKNDFDFFPVEYARQYRRDDARVRRTGKFIPIAEKGQPFGAKRRHTIEGFKARTEDGGILCIFWDVGKYFRRLHKRQLADLLYKLTQDGEPDENGSLGIDTNDMYQMRRGRRKSRRASRKDGRAPGRDTSDEWIPLRKQLKALCVNWGCNTEDIKQLDKSYRGRFFGRLYKKFKDDYPHAVQRKPGKLGTHVKRHEWSDFLEKPDNLHFKESLNRKLNSQTEHEEP